MNYISLRNVLAKTYRDVGLPMEESDVIEWAAEALSHIGAPAALETVTAFAEVKNYRLLLPTNFKTLLSIAKNECYEEDKSTACPAAVVTEDTVVTDCNGNIINECDYTQYYPAYDVDQYFAVFGNPVISSCYHTLRQATGTFFEGNALPNYNNLHGNDYDFKIIFPYIQFSFQEGFVAMSYTRVKMEDTLPMVPDYESYREALARYVRYKLLQRKIDRGENIPLALLQMAEADWHWYCKQARNEAVMHQSIADHENKLMRSLRKVPPIYSYDSYFGSLNQVPVDSFKLW